MLIAFFKSLVPWSHTHTHTELPPSTSRPRQSVSTQLPRQLLAAIGIDNMPALLPGLQTLVHRVIRHPMVQTLPSTHILHVGKATYHIMYVALDQSRCRPGSQVSEFTVVHSCSLVNRVHCLFPKSMHFPNILVGRWSRRVLEGNFCCSLRGSLKTVFTLTSWWT